MKKMFGIGASSGIAIGKVLKLVSQKPHITSQKINNTDEELLKLDKAIKTTISQIHHIKNHATKNLKPKDLAVFDAHLQIVEDPIFKEEIISLITNQKDNVMFAVDTISQKYINIFMAMDNQYMRERAADVKDVTKRLINNLAGVETIDLANLNQKVIIVSDDITPSETAQMNKKYVLGFATNIGGKTSHAAIMARSLEIPAVLGLKDITEKVKNGDEIALDGEKGLIVINPTSQIKKTLDKEIDFLIKEKKRIEKYRHQKTLSKDKIKFELAANIGSLHDIENVIKHDAESVGLFRTEFLYMDNDNWPSEEEQFHAYKTVLQKMNDKLVVIRTLDIGGDKQLKYFKFPQEDNPFLGYRAIRLTLNEPEIFKTQLRALIRASRYGNLAIMFPMIATIDELKKAREIYQNVYKELKEQHVNISDKIQLGMMIEVPSAAILARQFAKYVDFFSIGTNDLMQYTMAHDRMNTKVSYLYQPLNPSILTLIKNVIDSAHYENKWVGMCGEMAGDPKVIPFLVGMKLNELSMSANLILKTREQISKINHQDAQKLVAQALNCDTSEEVENLLNEFNKSNNLML